MSGQSDKPISHRSTSPCCGSRQPPRWDNAPSEFQADLAALDRLDDKALWQIVRSQQSETEMEGYEDLLHKNANGTITPAEREMLTTLRREADRLMLRKAHAAALLRWRGYEIPPADRL